MDGGLLIKAAGFFRNVPRSAGDDFVSPVFLFPQLAWSLSLIGTKNTTGTIYNLS